MTYDEAALGAEPLGLPLYLVQDADFVCELESEDGDWPTTIEVTLEVTGQTWEATRTGALLRFEVDKVDVNAAIDAGAQRYRLLAHDGDTDLVWSQGQVLTRLRDR